MSNDLFANDNIPFPPVTRQEGAPARRPRELTGWTVLYLIVSFFAVVIGVNAFMAHEALSTFGGLETDSAYKAGQLFERDIAMARAQDAQHWQVEAKVTPAAEGNALLDIDARDASGARLTGMTATASFARPTDQRLDRTVTVSEDAPGHFHGSAVLAAGQWDLIIELSRQGDRQFRSKNRVVIR
jgi:nitrogen fixation protein FixH